ncbi:MAG: hypothetical protein ACRDBG_14025 [Waterburya sp.]
METLKALLKDYSIDTEIGDTFVVPEYEESINLIVSTNLTYEYLVEGYYVVVNDANLSNFLKVQ